MSLAIPNPRIYTNPQGQTWPGVSDVAHGSYVTDGHIAPNGSLETFNEDVTLGRVPATAVTVLSRAGWDGTVLTHADKQDLVRFADHNGHSFAFNIHDAYEQVWRERGEGGATQPPPVPPLAGGEQGSELYESGHDISTKLPKATFIRRAVGSLETAWGGINAMINQARLDGVPDSEQALKTARDGLLGFFYALNDAFQQGRDYLLPLEQAEVQTSCDQVWNAVHAARKLAAAAKETGWILVANDPRPAIYKWSRHNRCAWTGLNNLTTACGLYGIHGEILANGQRSAHYVDPFESWESQDPLREQVGGGGGINIPQPKGQPALAPLLSFADACAKRPPKE